MRRQPVTQEEKLAHAKAALSSAWWPGYAERLKAREVQLHEKLIVGGEARMEDRLRGAIGALRWAQTFLQGDITAARVEARQDGT